MDDKLTHLVETATGAEQSAGSARVDALTASVREYDTATLPTVEQGAADEFERLYNNGDYAATDIDTMEALADVTDAVRAVSDERKQAEGRLATAAGRVRASADTDEPADPDNGDGDGDGSDGDEEQTTGATTADGGAPDGDGPDDDDQADEDAPEDADNGTTQASTGRNTPKRRTSTTAALNKTRNTPVQHTEQSATPLRSFSITASAEIPDVPHGKSLSVRETAEAAASRFSNFPVGETASGTLKANVARINRHHGDTSQLTGDNTDIDLIDKLADEKRMPGGSVVAAAKKQMEALTAASQAPSMVNDVWCTPSETDYTLCPPLATTEGMLDLPTAGMPARGGIRYPVWKDYPEQEAETGTDQAPWRGQVVEHPNDPSQPNAGIQDPNYFHNNHKKCISGPCVEWNEVRASLSYLCITSDILRDRTFPEGLERFTSDVLTHHQHYLNETYLQHILAHADPIPAFSVQNGDGAIGSSSLTVVDRLALLVTWMRGKYKMAAGATLEIVAPAWFREYLKRDIEKKQNRPFGAVSNAEVAELFATYASRVQWVLDWQEIPNGTPVNGHIMPPNGWPNNVSIMAYPAGSWVLSEGNVLSLGVQYDHQLLMENRYSAMFTEDMWMLLNRCNRTFSLTLTDLCANGAVGPEVNACDGTTPTPTIESVAVTPPSASFAVGATQQLTAEATMSDQSKQDVTTTATWSSADGTVASVNNGGLVTGEAAGGPVDVTAKTANNKTDASAITVTAAQQAQVAGGDSADSGSGGKSSGGNKKS